MKIFAYNMQTKVRGELLDERSGCSGHGAAECFGIGDSTFYKLDNPSAVDKQGIPITAEQYKRNAIIFCIGKQTCGTDTSWVWVISN